MRSFPAACSLALLVATSAGAQSLTLARDCVRNQIDANTGSLWYDARPSAFFKATSGDRDAGNWSALIDRMRSDFVTRDSNETDRARVFSRLDTLAFQMAGREKMPAQPFNVATYGDTAYSLFGGSTELTVIGEAMPIQRRRALCWVALEAVDLQSAFLKDARLAFVSFINQREDRWTRFREQGFQMLPFELILNSHFGFPRPALEPPPAQWIFLHPSVGVEMPASTGSGGKGTDALLFEPLGVVFYVNDHKTFGSLSLGTSMRAGAKAAWGPVLHLGRLGHIGYLYRPTAPTGEGRHVIAVSPNFFNNATALTDEFKKDIQTLADQKLACIRNLQLCQKTPQ